MGLGHSPRIVTDGMVLCLDAINPKNFNLTEVMVLVVAGGGGGGTHHGGGGGGGGIVYNTKFSVTPGSALTVTVGGGGSGGTYSPNANGGNGGNSVFGSITAVGGGGGGTYPNSGVSGGSGGGSNNWSTSAIGGSATSGQGFAGGSNNGQNNYGGGGGGAGGTAKGLSNNSGGDGLSFSISGTLTDYGGGGGSGVYPGYADDTSYGYGGLGGGGNGGNGPHGSGTFPNGGGSNTGGGGGGVADLYKNGAAGGSGIVIVRYPGSPKAVGGTITTSYGHTVHTFTTVGSTTFTPILASNGSIISGLSDFSGRGNFVTTANSPTYSSANGGSIVFDGVNDYIELNTNNIITGTNPFTFEAFYKVTNTSVAAELFGNYGSGYTSNTIWISGRYGVWINGSVPYFQGHPLGLGTYHMAFTRTSDGVCTLYKNGAVDGTATSTTSISASQNFRIGSDVNGIAEVFGGELYCLKVYNKVLTSAEISQNFNALRGRFGI